MDFLGYSFVEVNVFPPCDEKYYQLYVNGSPKPFVYSQSHLLKCFDSLNSFLNDN